jgi:acetolactate synthase I/II/III large subunit
MSGVRTTEQIEGHGGTLAVAALERFGVREIFTLSGGHIFPVYDACVQRDVRIVDTRHEQTAAFAAEGVAKLTRRPGVAVLTAGPGVTNAMSAITTARFNGAPVAVLGGRAPQARWGAGSLQEIDHVPFVEPVTKWARTVTATSAIPAEIHGALTAALTPHRGPLFCDFPLDVLFGHGTGEVAGAVPVRGVEPDPDEVAKATRLLAAAERPVLVAGGDVYWDGAWEALRTCVEELRIPTFANGLGRGCLPADHELFFSRTRSMMKEADVVVVVGTPLDFRLRFGAYQPARVIHVVDSPDSVARHAEVDAAPAGDLATVLEALAASGRAVDREPWIARMRDAEQAARRADEAELGNDADPVHPARVYGEVRKRLDRDAVVVCDGGDFVSYAGRFIDSYEPGCWLDTGPFGCLGSGLGHAIAARVVHPDRQVVMMMGDGAFGFGGLDFDTLVRHQLPVVAVIGNNGIWGLEKHPMRALYGYDVAADLQPGCRYDEVVAALGGAGELVERPGDLGPALDRALASGVPYVVNVVTDPEVSYPRSSNLA